MSEKEKILLIKYFYHQEDRLAANYNYIASKKNKSLKDLIDLLLAKSELDTFKRVSSDVLQLLKLN